jgi:hypothetical protein
MTRKERARLKVNHVKTRLILVDRTTDIVRLIHFLFVTITRRNVGETDKRIPFKPALLGRFEETNK